jgi:uncharacterized protein (TIGR02231 family)
MHKLSLLLVLALTAASVPASAITAEHKITAVTVYPDRALVTRTGSVQLNAGVQSVVFEGLPLNLEEDSVRAKASSTGKLKIIGVEMRRDYKEVAMSAGTKQLQDDLTKLDDQIRALNDEKNDLQRRDVFLDQIRNKVANQPNIEDGKPASASVQNIEGLFQLYGTETSKITNRQRDIEFALRDLNKQRGDKASQLALLQQPATPNTRSAIVTVEATDAGSADLQVSYLIAGAGWQPQYDAYADPDTQKVELTYYGVVRQTTGENWDNVAMTLSSARPTSAARLPELGTWTIDFGGQAMDDLQEKDKETDAARMRYISKSVAQGSANAAANVPMSEPDAATAPAAPAPADASMETAEVRSLGPAATFVVAAKTSIPSDNQPHRNAISVQTLKGDWTYETTPKLVASAFLKTKVTNTSGGPLLAGEINAFLGNNFVGKSSIGLVAANATFDLFLGADENIKVTRTEGVAKEEVGGILSRMRVCKRSFTIEVENFKTTEASFKLRDQLPVSRNGQITVAVDQAEPAFKVRDENTGEVNWEFKLKPNAKQKITVEYEVDAPYNTAIAGI